MLRSASCKIANQDNNRSNLPLSTKHEKIQALTPTFCKKAPIISSRYSTTPTIKENIPGKGKYLRRNISNERIQTIFKLSNDNELIESMKFIPSPPIRARNTTYFRNTARSVERFIMRDANAAQSYEFRAIEKESSPKNNTLPDQIPNHYRTQTSLISSSGFPTGQFLVKESSEEPMQYNLLHISKVNLNYASVIKNQTQSMRPQTSTGELKKPIEKQLTGNTLPHLQDYLECSILPG